MQALVYKIAHKHHLINTLPVLAPATQPKGTYDASVSLPCHQFNCWELKRKVTDCNLAQVTKSSLGKQVLQLIWASMNVPNDEDSALPQPV